MDEVRVYVFDPTEGDRQSKVRGVGRYLQILKENFPQWIFINKIENWQLKIENSIFINPFFNFLLPPLTLKRIAKKQIAVIHDLIPLKYPKHFPPGIGGAFNIFLNKIALRHYDLIITDSYASKKDIVEILKIDETKIKVIYPCLPKIFNDYKIKTQNSPTLGGQNVKTNKNIKISNQFCLYVGDATWNKNLVSLAKAIKTINVTCIFVGKVFENRQLKIEDLSHPWHKELKEFLSETKDDRRFVFVGFVDDYKLIKLYQQSSCNVLISRDEGFGFSYLEASSFGAPSVLSKIPIFEEIAADSAYFADYNNPNDIADKIGELYFNQDLRNRVGFKAQKRSKIFSQQNFKKSFLSIIYG